MSKSTFNEVLAVGLGDYTSISNTTSETILVPDFTFAAYDSRIYPGATFRYSCYYDVSFVATTPGTLVFALRWGGVAGTVLAQSGAYAPDPTGALANRSGWVETLLTWRTVTPTASGSSAFAMGKFHLNDYDDASATTLQGNLAMGAFGSAGANTPAAVSSLDTTTSKALSLTAKFSVSTNPTNITAHQWILEQVN